MNAVFKPFLRKFVIVFFDDILVYSNSIAEHFSHLRTVFQCLATNQLYAKMSKGLFAQESVEYLGHIISSSGIHVDSSKISAMLHWPPPQNLKQVRGFLGLTGYYRKFIKHYASVAAPLTDLLKKDAFTWTDSAQQAFIELKCCMTSAPVLALPTTHWISRLKLMLPV
ncbi:uncharacterized mitochondrial protein AtMg00860-like [Telopea speciosissima]|uniref:uncharacterized mitochondrial protein AtMg00860-like n=1 Tax=Telopea speciosissima TaxID=54955 RepID=UPI001CC66D68|nr:uncharacterized mitochondrial protein AtMg00860-like [Telopea speciosissima]